MCIEILACCDSDKTCCIFFKNKHSIKYIQFVDWVELLLNLAALIYFLNYADTLLLPILVVILGNFLPVSIRLLGSFIRWCGCFKLWTRKAFFSTRVFALVCQIVVLMSQICLTLLIFKNIISFSSSRADEQAIDDNYDRLSYGLCVFCSPDECQNGYEDYL